MGDKYQRFRDTYSPLAIYPLNLSVTDSTVKQGTTEK